MTLDVQVTKKLKGPSLAFLMNVHITRNGIAGRFAPKAAVVAFIKDIELASMAILGIWDVQLGTIKGAFALVRD